ncbi:Endonuclease/Exonuclease/phosphatase family protein [Geodermatophilus africanus]|uniref:Endonuclease/Exonuclease/phosphatase family protein n=1 Tax=Geodermatophilus africanus TaxID=1137993 RepID=A0A1H3DCK7_9ACTN|nr:endonuclease/exonuclease/phosphatase family protein [Geodermatophilus africanus]SDX63424.1 Endonuclease/Exonuclease/phosphatase family protein [Geodermatophilus africanus]
MFTVMTWNVENLFTPKPADRAAFDAKLDALAAVVTAEQPDLVGVQGIGDEDAFEQLRGRLGPAWTGVLSTHFESPHTHPRGLAVPRPLTDVEQVVDLPAALAPVKVDDDGTTITRAGHGALAVTATTGDSSEVRAITAHLKSKLLSFPGGRFDTTDEGERVRCGVYALNRRAAEAAALREWATAALAGAWAGRPVVVCGDLNDTLDAATTQLLYRPPGSQYGPGGYNRPDRGDAQRLWAIGYRMDPPDDWSRINQGRRELIDHILISHALTEHLTEARTVPLEVPSVGVQPQTPARAAGEPPSDHRPVLARFDL